MTDRMGLTEFFAMEAGEYLERLDTLVSPHTAPNSGEVVRLARALRGSALMAKQQGIAGAVAAFENLARAVDEGRRAWEEEIRQLAIGAIDDLKIFVRAAGTWSEAEDQRATKLADELDRAAGRSSAAHRAPVTDSLDAGTRAFIGREGAAVASALDQAAKALQQNPLGHDPLTRALNLMQPLRGLASLAELPPLPDLLDGVEHAIGELTRRTEPVDDAALLFNAAAKALSRAAQEAATVGRPEVDSPEARDFAERLRRVMGLDREVLPIEALFHDDEGPHIVEEGTRPAHPAELGRLEIVSHGEHLEKAADDLEHAVSATQRDLRAQALAGTFRALSAAGGDVLHDAVGRFAYAASDALGRGAAISATEGFVNSLRDAAAVLEATGTQGNDELAERMESATRQIQALRADPPVTVEPPPHVPYTRPPAESVAASAAPVTAEADEVMVPPSDAHAAPPAPSTPSYSTEEPNLAGSWVRYQRYVESLGLGEPSLDELVAGPPADPALGAGAGVGAEAAVPTTGDVLPVTELQYAGAAAVERAHSLREKIRAALRQPSPDTAQLDELIEEVFDLVELARTNDN